MDALLKALKEAFKDTNIHEEDFILECVESVITTNSYGSTYVSASAFFDLSCVREAKIADDSLCTSDLLNELDEVMENY
mgnify:CR=1 FL=1